MENVSSSWVNSTIPVTQQFVSDDVELGEDITSDAAVYVVNLIVVCGVQTTVAAMGVFTNVITLLVLAAQGLKDTVNISLFALALSDLAYVITVLPGQAFCLDLTSDEELAESIRQRYIPHGAMLIIAFSRISNGLTAVISVERCLCVMLPLKVQRLVTVRCTLFTIIVVYVTLMALFAPVLMMYELQDFDMGNNRTLPMVAQTQFFKENYRTLSVFADTVISVAVPVSLLVIVTVCTSLTVLSLKLSSKWRQSVSSSSTPSSTSMATPSTREARTQPGQPNMVVPTTRKPEQKSTAADVRTARLTRMMVAIACIYIACIIPGTVSTLVRLFVPEFTLTGRYSNTFFVVYGIDFTLQTANSSVNFFVYMAMSSRFRQVFISMATVLGCKCPNRKTVQDRSYVTGDRSVTTSILDTTNTHM